MKPLFEYIKEAQLQLQHAQWFKFSLNDLMQWDIWQPNDDLSHNNLIEIGKQFFKKYPSSKNPQYYHTGVNKNSFQYYHKDPSELNNCCNIAGCTVKCEVSQTDVIFTLYYSNATMNDMVKVIEEIVNMLTNTVYSVGPGKDAKRLIKAMLNKI